MTRLLYSAVRAVAEQLPAAWNHACAVVGGLFIALLALGLVHATEPWGTWLLNHASIGAH